MLVPFKILTPRKYKILSTLTAAEEVRVVCAARHASVGQLPAETPLGLWDTLAVLTPELISATGRLPVGCDKVKGENG